MDKPLNDKEFNAAVVYASENMHTCPDKMGMRVMCQALVMMLWERDAAQIAESKAQAQLAAAVARAEAAEAQRDALKLEVERLQRLERKL